MAKTADGEDVRWKMEVRDKNEKIFAYLLKKIQKALLFCFFFIIL